MSNLIPNIRTKKLPTVQQAIAWIKSQAERGQEPSPLFIVVFDPPAAKDREKTNYKYADSLVAIKAPDGRLIPTRSTRENKAQISASVSASISRVARSGLTGIDLRILSVPADWKIPSADDFSENLLNAIEQAGIEERKKKQ